MWRLVVSELAGKIVHKGQRPTFLGTIKIHIKAIYIRGQRVSSALFSSSTKPIFRSESARYVLFIQMSKEMWDFDADGTGEIMFDKVVNGFLPDLFKRWQKINARHLVTIVMFTRLESKPREHIVLSSMGMAAVEQPAVGGSRPRDFYRVVVGDMPSGEWSDILVQLKKEFRVFLRDVSTQASTEDNKGPSRDQSIISGQAPSQIVPGNPTPALRGNILEAVNLASSQFSCDYIDRDLVRTGVSVIVITPGPGLFEVDYNLLTTTTDNLIENGVGIDLVCLSQLPLYSVPLFKYRPPSSSSSQISEPRLDQTQEPSSSWLNDNQNGRDEQLTRGEGEGGREALSQLGAMQGRHDMEWSYGIPHWVDVSFWTPSSQKNGAPFVSMGGRGHDRTVGGRGRRKPFIPRTRMYELQMMGVMENSINQIRLPFLKKTTLRRDRRPAAPRSLSQSTPPNARSPSHRTSMLRQMAEGSPQTPSSSVKTRSNFLKMRQTSQYQWMDDHDEMLFRHPKQRVAAERNMQDHTSTAADMDRQNHNTTLDHITSNSVGTKFTGEMRSTGGQHIPKQPVEGRATSVTEGSNSTARAAIPSSTVHPKAPQLSRRISLGFRGFGGNTPKATASTEVSVEHANSIKASIRRHQAARKPKFANTGLPYPAVSVQQPGEMEPVDNPLTDYDGSLVVPSTGMNSGRPIPIRNPTELRIFPQNAHVQTSHKPPRLVLQHDQMPDLSDTTSAEDRQMSPKTALAPWLTVINPSNPHQADIDATSRLGRWQHVFPRKLRASKIKWKSLCSPAAVPLTTEIFPSAEELATEYESSTYKIDLPPEDELLEHPRSRNWLIRELMAFRFSQGFQVVVGSRLAKSLYLPNFESFDVFDDDRLSHTDTIIVMTKGSLIHRISTAEEGHVQIGCLSRRPIAAQSTAVDTNESDAYQPMVRTMLAEEYALQSIAFTSTQPKLDWNHIDHCIAGHLKIDYEKPDENLRSWRARLVLIPVPPAYSTRHPLHSHSEVREEETRQEELRIEGIRKLTQVWQRFRHVPPSERRFQASSMRKRKDTNPLDIMYQTKNPSEIVTAEKDSLDEDVSAGKPVQLLPESELFQRSTLNLQMLAQTIQGEKGIRMMDRRWHLKLHFNCFIGSELTYWLLQNFRDVDSQEEAVELGNHLMQNGLFQHVEKRHDFRDGNYFYQVASEYRSARPESRTSWFGSRRADKSVPSTPVSEGPGHESPKAPGSRSGTTEDASEDASSTPTEKRQQLGVALSKALLYDVDHRKRSYRPELVTLHYDRLHNPDNCYHIRLDWFNATSKFIEDAIVSWAASVERFGLRLVEVPLAEASAITSMHPFRAPALVKLAKMPPSEHPRTSFDATSFTPQPKSEKHYYQKEIMKRFEFFLDFEAASDFPADVDVTYSWGKPDYKYPQYVHRSGTLLAQITDEGDFLLLANRLYNNRSPAAPENTHSEEALGREGAGMSNRFGTARSGKYRGSPRGSPSSSPLIRAAVDPRPPTSATQVLKDASTFATPENIKKQFEDFCADSTALEDFYAEVVNARAPSTPVSRAGTPMMESSIPTLGLPPSMMLRDRSPGAEIARRKTRIFGRESPRLTPRKSGEAL